MRVNSLFAHGLHKGVIWDGFDIGVYFVANKRLKHGSLEHEAAVQVRTEFMRTEFICLPCKFGIGSWKYNHKWYGWPNFLAAYLSLLGRSIEVNFISLMKVDRLMCLCFLK